MESLHTPDRIAERAERIYEQGPKTELESSHSGEFVVIDVSSESHFVAKFAEDALQKARKECPYGIFHLIRIGAPGAFRFSHPSRAEQTDYRWPLR